MTRRAALLTTVLAALVVLPGCANPDAPAAGVAARKTVGNAGEPPAPKPPAVTKEHPAAPQATPQAAVERFASLYTNWDYRTLAGEREKLQHAAVGAARLDALQASAAAQDPQLARDRVWNRGEIVAVSGDRGRRGWWLVVTREQTGGGGEYEALPAGFHVTLALPVPAAGGWAVSEWQPQS